MAVERACGNAAAALRQQPWLPGADAANPCCEGSMIGPGTGVSVYVACGVTGHAQGQLLVLLCADPRMSCAEADGRCGLFAFRAAGEIGFNVLFIATVRAFCLYYKVLEPRPAPLACNDRGGRPSDVAQLAMLWKALTGAGRIGAAPPRRVG